MAERPVFYYDLGSPYPHLAAERVNQVLPVVPVWQPTLLGGHIVGARAAEMIQELVNARQLEGGFQEVARTVHAHPTFSEATMEAARAADGWLIHG